MKDNKWIAGILVMLALAFSNLACGSSTDGDQQVRTLVGEPAEESSDIAILETPAEPTPVPPTNTPEIEGLVKEGTYLVGNDIQPGIYVGLAGEDIFDTCYWERLSSLSGEFDAIIANSNSAGLYYVEILDSDYAFTTGCELLPIDAVKAPESFLSTIKPGTYLVGRDISPGTYKGEAGESCYWERLSCVNGRFDCIIANDNVEGQFYVEIAPSDFAFTINCEATITQ
jgi:hypothetical protein